MAKNDVVLIDAIVDDRLREGYPSNQRDEVFEFLAFEQVLKDLDLSREEIETSWMDGRDDGGIDGFFIFVNGYVALLTVARLLGRFSYGITDLAGLNVALVTPALAIEMWRLVESVQRMPAKEHEFRNVSFVLTLSRLP